MTEDNVLEELGNIVRHYPLWPGDTISHDTAYECISRGWAYRGTDSHFYPTKKGYEVWAERAGT